MYMLYSQLYALVVTTFHSVSLPFPFSLSLSSPLSLLPSLPSHTLFLLSFFFSLALVDDNTLLIGSVDQIQMLHIQTIPLGETPKYTVTHTIHYV